MNKTIIVVLSLMMIALVSATIISISEPEKTVFAKPNKSIEIITAQNVTFLCDGLPMKVRVNANDVKNGHDDEFENDGGLARTICLIGNISEITDWEGNVMVEFEGKRSFDKEKIKKIKCNKLNRDYDSPVCTEKVKVEPVEEPVNETPVI